MNERLLKIDFVSSGDSLGKPWNHSFQFTPSINLPEKSSIALNGIRMWNNLRNISATRGNNTFKYSIDGITYKTVVLQDGTYSIENINTAVQGLITAQGDVGTNVIITGNYSTLKCDITLLGGYTIDFTTSTIRNILGFDAVIVNSSSSGANVVDITNGITSFSVNLNIIDPEGSFLNGKSSDSVFVFSPDVSPGSLINQQPSNLLYIPISSTSIQRFSITLTDQNGRLLTDLGETEAVNTSFVIKSFV